MKFSVRVHPGASRERLVRDSEHRSFNVYVTKKAHKGQANKALLKLLAQEFHVPLSRIRIIQGQKSRNKLIEIGESG